MAETSSTHATSIGATHPPRRIIELLSIAGLAFMTAPALEMLPASFLAEHGISEMEGVTLELLIGYALCDFLQGVVAANVDPLQEMKDMLKAAFGGETVDSVDDSVDDLLSSLKARFSGEKTDDDAGA